ncbi:MAG: TadE/TadG family type IV pilus assembly protein [Anderseniella sp.]
MILKLCKTFGRVKKRFRKEEDGATAVEFAFVGAPFLFLMMATFETGLAFFAEYAVQNATTTASRLIRTGQAQKGGFSSGDFRTRLCAELPVFLDCSGIYINIDVRNNFAAAANRANASNNGAIDPSVSSGAAFNPGNAGDIVVVETFYEWQIFTPGLMKLLQATGTATPPPHFLANHGTDKRLIRGVTVFQNEPFS